MLTLHLALRLVGLDLREGDRRWLAIISGHHDAYTGEAVNPRYLSVFERSVLRHGRNYHPNAESAMVVDPAKSRVADEAER